MKKLFALFLLAALLCGCGEKKPPVNPSALTPTEGHGTVLSIDQNLGTGTLDIDGEVVTFWWNNQPSYVGSLANPEPTKASHPLNANVGDTLYFRGVENRGDIYITASAAIPPKSKKK
jgi:hypothetical protein